MAGLLDYLGLGGLFGGPQDREASAGGLLAPPNGASIPPGWGSAPVGRFVQGAADPLFGIAQLYTNLSPALWPAASSFNNGLSKVEADYQAQRRAAGDTGMDWSRIAGNALGPIGELATFDLPSRFAAALLANGVFGSMLPVTDAASTSDYWQKKGAQTAAGVLAGVGSAFVGNAAQSAARTLSANYPSIAALLHWLSQNGQPLAARAATSAAVQKIQNQTP